MQYVTLCCAYVAILCKVFSMSDFKTLQKSYHCWQSFSFSCLFRYSCICKFVPKTQGFVTLELRQITVLGIKYSLFIVRLESFPLDWTFLVVFFCTMLDSWSILYQKLYTMWNSAFIPKLGKCQHFHTKNWVQHIYSCQ